MVQAGEPVTIGSGRLIAEPTVELGTAGLADSEITDGTQLRSGKHLG
jgi:hypothetical protein